MVNALARHRGRHKKTADYSLSSVAYQRGSRWPPPPNLLPPPPPRLPPKPPPPRLPPKPRPPTLRFSRGLASLTFNGRPPTSLPLNWSMAEAASSLVDISIK